MKSLYLLLIGMTVLSSCNNVDKADENAEDAQEMITSNEKSELWTKILQMDSILFQSGFNQIDTAVMSPLISEDLEFYHDQHGAMNGKNDFLQSIISIGELPFRTERKLLPEQMDVFPLYSKNGQELYGALQSGIHEFYQQASGEVPHKSGIALFTHLWILQEGNWKLKRVLSYDHRSAD